MSRWGPVAVLLAGSVAGCKSTTPADNSLLEAVLEETANVCSQAKIPGPRSASQIARVTSQCAELKALERKLASK